jgi:hypothetical protein
MRAYRSHLRGATRAALLAGLALAGALLVAWSWRGRAAPQAAVEAPAEARAARPVLVEPRDHPQARVERVASGTAPERERFDGRGRLRGELVLGARVEQPREWTLVLEPHPWNLGRDRARAMRVEHAAGEREFVVEDLPLAAWQVRVEARGLNSTRADVLLVRGSPDAHVVLRLDPPGLVDGELVDADGQPAEGVLVVLEAHGERRETRSDQRGMWRFDEVVDGTHRLWTGPPEAPLLQPVELDFAAPSLRAPRRQLPVCGALELEVLEPGGAPVVDAQVSGFGDPQGSLRGRTDATGRLAERWLWPGGWRLQVRSQDGRLADFGVEVDPRATTRRVVVLPAR